MNNTKPLFKLGKIVATVGADAAMQKHGIEPISLLWRHVRGDWGEIAEADRGLNEAALEDGARILSVYKIAEDETIWIITEWDRSATTLLLPEEY